MRSVRFTIAGLMGVVLVLALGFAALRNPAGIWGGMVPFVTRGVLCLAVVGAICRRGAERAWWIGFALFGWNYFGLPFGLYPYVPRLATSHALEALAPALGVTIERNAGYPEIMLTQSFFLVGHCLWALIAAVVGGFLARAIFGEAASRAEDASSGPQPTGQSPRNRWVAPAVILLAGAGLITAVSAATARTAPGLWAGVTYLLTWWLLGLTALGAVIARGRRREFWLGATFFGAGFLLLVFSRHPGDSHEPTTFPPTVRFLEALRLYLENGLSRIYAEKASAADRNMHILTVLEQRVPIYLPPETTLQSALTFIRDSTRTPDGKAIPIFVDPAGLSNANRTMRSKVEELDLEEVELRTSLRLVLNQIDLEYVVKDGLLMITSEAMAREMAKYRFSTIEEDSYQTAGHCLLALVAAVLGGFAAPFVFDLARKRAA